MAFWVRCCWRGADAQSSPLVETYRLGYVGVGVLRCGVDHAYP